MTTTLQPTGILKAADSAIRAIPPAWPLDATVAVNPFIGQTAETLAQTAARLGRVAGLDITPARAERRRQVAAGEITHDDLGAALEAAPADQRPASLEALLAALATHAPAPVALPTVADLAAAESGTDWPGLIAERFSVWAAGWFDEGQALWHAPTADGAFTAWRAFATHDLTPEIIGLQGFAAHVAAAPRTAANAIARATETLGLDDAAVETAYHQLLMTLGGWAQAARYRLWVAELAETQDATALDLLAIRLLWEEALFLQYRDDIEPQWIAARSTHAAPLAPSADQAVDAILQEAAERAAQRKLSQVLTGAEPASGDRPSLQAAFCIDVRSEVFRRALESADPGVRTLGFAGFFGLGAAHTDFASDVEERRLPVLLNPGVSSRSGGEEDCDRAARYRTRAHRAWGRFRLAAVSSFAFVEATGPLYIAKLARDALGLAEKPKAPAPAPRFDPALTPEQRIDTAATVLGAMSLTGNFARIVLLAGHGANVVNNPHASALHCGACGGYSGEVNARLLTGLLNDPEVRTGLKARGIVIPEDTLFIAGLHDTTTDAVTLYEDDHPAQGHGADLDQLRRWLAAAGDLARAERATRLPRAETADQVAKRSRDWAETRPEWGLAGCSAFIAAPRAATAGKRLDGRTFLHDYDWGKDEGFGVLELILTAPVVVASWISLQYYGSAVAPAAFGGGDKLLHNVVGGIGVVEGNGGLLRPGLPWQSVHDGEALVHEPLRLTVAIQAPTDAMTDILTRHPGVRDLFDNRWLHLVALDDAGRMAQRYVGGGQWAAFEAAQVKTGETASDAAVMVAAE